MKRIIIYSQKLLFPFLVLFLFLLFVSLNTQAQSAGEMFAGIKVGAASSTFALDGQSFTGPKTGLAAGGFAKYQVNDFIGVALEALYVQQGATNIDPRLIYNQNSINNIQASGDLVNTDIVLHNIDIPVVACINFPGYGGDVIPSVIIGGAMGMNMSARAKNYIVTNINNSTYSMSVYRDEGISTNFNLIDFAFVFGAGLEFDGDNRYVLDVKYRMGFRNINDYMAGLYDQFYNNSLIVTFGVGFGM